MRDQAARTHQADLVRTDLVQAIRNTFARDRRNERQELRAEEPPTELAGSDDFPEPLRPPRTDR